ncbi:MAG: hypothetical protein LWW77_06650 [Propionibacteriales bacterium]|nr:hypothetical protein [Propionibacteriales bacterium]
MPSIPRWLTLLLVLVTAAGCQSPSPPGTPDPLEVTASPTVSIPPAPVVYELASNRATLPWTLLGMSADRRRIFISYGVGDGCAVGEGHVYVRETPTYVGIASAPTGTGANRSPGNACAAMLKTADGYIDLAEPLGTRQLIHLPQS